MHTAFDVCSGVLLLTGERNKSIRLKSHQHAQLVAITIFPTEQTNQQQIFPAILTQPGPSLCACVCELCKCAIFIMCTCDYYGSTPKIYTCNNHDIYQAYGVIIHAKCVLNRQIQPSMHMLFFSTGSTNNQQCFVVVKEIIMLYAE